MTLTEFAAVFAPLAIQLRQTDADAATIRAYYPVLKDLELEFVAMAAQRLAQQSEWFPKTSEWRAMAAKIEGERTEAQRALLRKLPTPLCLACSDTGWARDDRDRVSPCECRHLRRLEVLGRRPWPELPAAAQRNSDNPIGSSEAASLKVSIERQTGRRIGPRAMPETWASRRARRDDENPEVTNG